MYSSFMVSFAGRWESLVRYAAKILKLGQGQNHEITFRVNKENWAEQPWQLDASSTQVAPRMDGFGGNPIFSNIAASR